MLKPLFVINIITSTLNIKYVFGGFMDYAYIENLVLKSKAHDINSKDKILEEFRPFIIRTSKNIFIDGYTFDDIVNECYKTLFACIKSYDSQTHRFVAYATISIKNNIHYLLRKSIKRRNSEGKEALVLDDSLTHVLKSNDDIENTVLENLLHDSLKKALDALTDDEQELINCIYYEGNSIKTYAQMKNISYFNVFHARKKIFNKLHTFMG